MASIPPNIVGLIFAKRIEIDLESVELSLNGLFHDRSFSNFPTEPVEKLGVAQCPGGRGEGILQLAVHSLDAMEEYDIASGWT